MNNLINICPFTKLGVVHYISGKNPLHLVDDTSQL